MIIEDPLHPSRQMKVVLRHGAYYFPTYEHARAYAHRCGLATDRFVSYGLGWAIQYAKSGPYWGPDGWA